jgi:hypothetical protein
VTPGIDFRRSRAGYDLKDGKIVVVEDEAEQVRLIYRRYLELSGV